MIIIVHKGNHGPHISLLAKLLKLQHRIVCPQVVWDLKWDLAYGRTSELLMTWAKDPHDVALWRWYIETQTVYSDRSCCCNWPVLRVDEQNTLNETVIAFLKQLHEMDIMTDLHMWCSASIINRNIIQKTWEIVLMRPPEIEEIEYWNEHTARNTAHIIDFFSWLMILHFSYEGKRMGLHIPFLDLFREVKWSLPCKATNVALVFTGYARDYDRYFTSYQRLREYIFIDIFVHTWKVKAPRMDFGEVDANLLEELLRPVAVQIEDIKDKDFSLESDILFFNMKQPKNNASYYENADMYSMFKASLMVKDHEIEKGKQYDVMIKLPFAYQVNLFDVPGILDRCDLDICWLPKGGGCTQCNREFGWPYMHTRKTHDDHYNSIDMYWMFGKRHIMMRALEMYLHAYAIAEGTKEDNKKNYLTLAKHKKFREFVYIFGTEYTYIKTYDFPVHEFSKPSIFRQYMRDYFCVSCDNISGEFTKFQIALGALGW